MDPRNTHEKTNQILTKTETNLDIELAARSQDLSFSLHSDKNESIASEKMMRIEDKGISYQDEVPDEDLVAQQEDKIKKTVIASYKKRKKVRS